MKKHLIIYHKEDNDGVFSAAIAAEYIRKENKDDVIDTKGMDYVMMANITKDDLYIWQEVYDNVIMVDISFSNPKTMKMMWEMFGSKFIWIDHHAPAIKSSFANGYDNVPGERGTDRSALMLTYKFFFDPLDEQWMKNEVPYILKVLSVWDSFTFSDEIHKDFAYDVNVGVTDYFRLSLTSIRAFVRNIIENGENGGDVAYFMEIGHTINKHNAWVAEQRLMNDGDFTWKVGNRQAVALFLQGATNSLMFESAKDRAKNGIVFKRKPDGNWVISLYNTNDGDEFHCGEFLKNNYGGGGHGGAAGATITQKQSIKLLSTKTL